MSQTSKDINFFYINYHISFSKNCLLWVGLIMQKYSQYDLKFVTFYVIFMFLRRWWYFHLNKSVESDFFLLVNNMSI